MIIIAEYVLTYAYLSQDKTTFRRRWALFKSRWIQYSTKW